MELSVQMKGVGVMKTVMGSFIQCIQSQGIVTLMSENPGWVRVGFSGDDALSEQDKNLIQLESWSTSGKTFWQEGYLLMLLHRLIQWNT